MNAAERDLRESIVATCRWMNAAGLNQGTSGNVSVRHGSTMLITPSGIPYDATTADMIAAMPVDGDYGSWRGPNRPSSEWRFHLDILRAKPEVGAVVHTHSIHATALAIARRPIPACHYMIAAFGGDDIRCAGYARFGTPALSELVLAGLDERAGCLLANHGMITIGTDLDCARRLAVELETIARQYILSLAVGGPVLLSAAEIAEARAGFADYGGQMAAPARAAPQPRRPPSRRPPRPRKSTKG